MKICTKCKIGKPIIEFPIDKYVKLGFRTYCKICYNTKRAETKLKNKEKYIERVFKYANSEIGYLRNKISQTFSKQNEKRTGISTTNKKEVEKYYYEYVKKHGRNCYYCFEPFTFVAKRVEVGVGKFIKKTKRLNLKNLSFDRLDNSKPYNIDNIIFCCQNCNVSKHDVSVKLIKRLYEVITERNL
jgi:5-methylcytosine-specific restriction endonuclease McrA